MSTFEPPPTYAMPIIEDPRTGKPLFNPIWLKWFIDFAANVTSSGAGSVSSVGLTMPGIFTVGGSPITGAGTLAVALASELANLIFAGPASGIAAGPTFRSMVLADLPASLQETAYDSWIGATLERVSAVATSAAGVVTLTVQQSGGGNLTLIFDGGPVTLTCPVTATLTLGSDIAPQINYVYVRQATPTVLTVSTTGFPTAEEYVPIGRFYVESAATVATYGLYHGHTFKEYTWGGTTENGHISYIDEWIRYQPATWLSGALCTPTLTVVGPDTLTIAVAAGTVLQLHPNTFPAFNSATAGTTAATTFFVPNHPTAYTSGKDLFNFKLTSANVAAGDNDRISWVIWGGVSSETGDCKVFVNLPSGFYNSDAGAIADDFRYTNYSIPSAYVGSGFLIAKLTYKYTTGGGGHLTLVENLDLRGMFPNTMAGGGGGGSFIATFPDNLFTIQNVTDATKQIQFSATSISTATTRTFTMPDANLAPTTAIATFLGTPSSANLAAALTDETGSGKAVFDTDPVFPLGITAGANSSGNYATIITGGNIKFKLSGDTPSQFGKLEWYNNSGTLIGNDWLTGDASAGIRRYQISTTGRHDFITGTASIADNVPQFRVAHTASPANFVQATGAATTASPVVSAQGSDTNIDLTLSAKGTGKVKIASAGISGGSIAGVTAVAGRNKVINGGFTVNQRKYVSGATLAAGSYGHDRWKGGSGGGDYTFTQLASNTQITIAANKTLIQVIEDKNVQSSSYVLSWTGTAQARYAVNSATPSGSYAASPITITGQTPGSTMSIEFGNGASSGTLGTVQLEPGDTQTTFEDRSYGQEFFLCQRYCPAIAATAALQMLPGMATCASTTAARFNFQFTVPARVAPTGIVVSNAADFSISDGVTNTACNAVTFSTAGTQSNFVEFGVAAGLTQFRTVFVYMNVSTAYLYFTGCEL